MHSWIVFWAVRKNKGVVEELFVDEGTELILRRNIDGVQKFVDNDQFLFLGWGKPVSFNFLILSIVGSSLEAMQDILDKDLFAFILRSFWIADLTND